MNNSWYFDDLEVDEDFEIKVNGTKGTLDSIKSMAGSSFVLNLNQNVLEFNTSPTDPFSVTMTINGTSSETLNGGLHLNMNPMAVCIGDQCMMWPDLPEPTKGQWGFEEITSDIPLTVDNKEISIEEVVAMGGQEFVLFCGPNSISFKNTSQGLHVFLNSDLEPQSFPVGSQLHLHISEMAVCFGDQCCMWPDLPASAQETPSMEVETSHPNTNNQNDSHHESVTRLKTLPDWNKNANSGAVIVDCSATWCAPCKKIAPFFHHLADSYSTKAKFYSVDIQENPSVKQKFKINALPTFLFLKDGKEIHRLVGDNESDLQIMVANFTSGLIKPEALTSSLSSEPTRTHYDYIVIGGGSGGMASAKEAAKFGAHVALFDFVKPSSQNTTWGLGGTCVNVGCVPKKLMHYAGLCGDIVEDAKAYGWDVKKGKHNWSKLVQNVQDHVKTLNFYYENGLNTANTKTMRNGETVKISNGSVTYYNALAKLTGPNSLSYSNNLGETGNLSGDNILISVGGRPFVPLDVPGVFEYSITSDDLFSLQTPPGKTLCVGAGYISLECGGFLTHLGFDVTISVRSIPLRTGGFDRDAVNKLISLMEKTGTKFLHNSGIQKIVKREDGRLNVTIKQGDNIYDEIYDTVLYATGRMSDTAGLDLQSAGVTPTSKGTLVTNERDQTNVPNVYAIGDVSDGKPELTPVAIQAGQLLARRLFGKSEELMNYKLVPTTVFTPFEYGICGYSEEDARKKYNDDINVYISEFSSLEIGAAHRTCHGSSEDLPTNSMSKLVCVKSQNDLVVGFHFVGSNAGEITQGFALALRLKATKKDFDDVVGIHPTDAESFMSLEVEKSSGEQWETSGGCGGGKCG
jgi:thioredoxin reductase (NADPH)